MIFLLSVVIPGCLTKIIFVSLTAFFRPVIENLLEKVCNPAGGYSDPIFATSVLSPMVTIADRLREGW